MKGQAVFVCPNCGEHFTSVDIDYRHTDHAIPMACPVCGTRTLDKHWNQTNIPDGWLITLIVGCLLLPFVLWRGFKRLIRLYFYKTYFQQTPSKDEKKKH